MALRELEARHASPRSRDYKLADGESLYLFVRANGSKLWRMKCHYDGREELLSFGRYPRPFVDGRPRRTRRAPRKGGAARLRRRCADPRRAGGGWRTRPERDGALRRGTRRWLHAGDTAQARGAAFLWALQDLPLGGTVLRRLDCAELNGAVELPAAALLVTFLPT